jgi:AcrR family transcriptional regulator
LWVLALQHGYINKTNLIILNIDFGGANDGMAWSKHSGEKKKRSYHHGNLKQALIDAALNLIAEKGPWGFTIAEAARSAGVSPAAPYRHYSDRDDLMADIAEQGFVRFESFLKNAWNDGNPDPVVALENVGHAYLAFARTEPALYAAMFEAGVAPDERPSLARAGDNAFAIMRLASEAVCSKLPANGRPPAAMVALHIWSLSHGIAGLFARGDDARRKLPMSPEELLEAGILVYLQGLGLERL